MKIRNTLILSLLILLNINNSYAIGTNDKYTNSNNLFDAQKQYINIEECIKNKNLNINVGAKVYNQPTEIYNNFIVISPENKTNNSDTTLMTVVIRTHINNIIGKILDRRLSVLTQNPSSYLISAHTLKNIKYDGNIYNGIISIPKQGQDIKAIESIAAEVSRIQKFGVTESELNLTIQELKHKAQIKLDNHNNTNTPYEKSVTDYQYSMQLLSTIKFGDINLYTPLYMAKNRALSFISSEGNITDTTLINAFEKGINTIVKAPKHTIYNTTILDTTKIDPGIIVSIATDNDSTTIWTLSNGAVVYYKNNKNINNKEIILKASIKGGYSMFNNKQYASAKANGLYISNSLVSTKHLTAQEIADATSGYDIEMNINILDHFTEINGKSFIGDIEGLFQLINLRLTNTEFNDDNIEVYKSSITQLLDKWEDSPELSFENQVTKSMAENKDRRFGLEELKQNIDSITVENSQDLFETIVSNSMGIKIFIVGNIPNDNIAKLAEKFLGSIKLGELENWKNRIDKKRTNSIAQITSPVSTSNTKVMIGMNKVIQNSYKANLEFTMYQNILEQRLSKIENIEDLNVTVENIMSYAGTNKTLKVIYSTNNTTEQKIRKLIIETIYSIANKGITTDEFEKSQTMVIANLYNEQRISEDLMNGMTDTYIENTKNYILRPKERNKIFEKIKLENIEKIAKLYLKHSIITEVIMIGK